MTRFIEYTLAIVSLRLLASRAIHAHTASHRGACERDAAPRIAVCIGGGARTFGVPAVHESIGQELIGNFADGAPREHVVIFPSLTLQDANDRAKALDGRLALGRTPTISTSKETVMRGLRHLNLSYTVAPPVLLHSSNSYDAGRCGALPPDPEFPVKFSWGEALAAAHQQSVLGQLETRFRCEESIKEWTRGHRNTTFDWIVFTRPDQFYGRPAMPYCKFASELPSVAHGYNNGNIFVLPSTLLEALGNGWRNWLACRHLTGGLGARGWMEVILVNTLLDGRLPPGTEPYNHAIETNLTAKFPECWFGDSLTARPYLGRHPHGLEQATIERTSNISISRAGGAQSSYRYHGTGTAPLPRAVAGPCVN